MTTDDVHYYDLRNRVYDKIDAWEKLDSCESEVQMFFKVIGSPLVMAIHVTDDPIVRQHFQALDGPYGKAYWEMLKAKQS